MYDMNDVMYLINFVLIRNYAVLWFIYNWWSTINYPALLIKWFTESCQKNR